MLEGVMQSKVAAQPVLLASSAAPIPTAIVSCPDPSPVRIICACNFEAAGAERERERAPEQTPWRERSSVMESFANMPFMPPMGHR